VVPGTPGVPLIVDGRDIAWAMVEGDWGLYRPGHVAPTATFAPRIILAPHGGYYPSTGRRPRYGRHEIEPPSNRLLPPPAESFHRSWSTRSKPGPVSEYPPFDPPPVILAPRPLRSHN
jgi:hypothetical protein